MFRPLPLFVLVFFCYGFLCFSAYSKNDTAEQRKLLEKISNKITKDYVRGWVFVTAGKIFNFDHSSYTKRQEASKEYFTANGFRSFYKALEQSGLVKIAVEKKQNIKGYTISPISVSDPKLINSNVFWTVSFRYVLEYHQQDTVTYQFLLISADIKDTSTEYERKLGVDRWLSSVDDNPLFCPCNSEGNSQKKMTLHDALGKHIDLEALEKDSLPEEDQEAAPSTEEPEEPEEPEESKQSPELEIPPDFPGSFPGNFPIDTPYQ